MAALPDEILIDIISGFSIKTIVTCRCESKTWYNLLSYSNSKFAQVHFKRSLVQSIIEAVDFTKFVFHVVELEHDTVPDTTIKLFPSRFRLSRDDFVAVNSCNGFLLLATFEYYFNPVIICNPITGEYLNLSNLEQYYIQNEVVSAFGYSDRTNEYKVVRLVRRRRKTGDRMVEVYTIGTKEWRSIGTASNSPIGSINNKAYCTTFFNGVIHWVCDTSIVSFDLESEKFGIVPLPHHLSTKPIENRYTIRIGVLGEFLYLSHNMELWVMKEYGFQESLTKACVVDGLAVGSYQVIKYLSGGDYNSKKLVNYDTEKLVSYDPVEKISKEFEVPPFCSTFETIAHVPSFMSFNDAMIGDTVYTFIKVFKHI